MNETPLNTRRSAISGRRLTVFVVFSLLLFTMAIGYGVLVYDHIQAARASSDSAWRELATELAMRYRRLERRVASAVDADQLPIEASERFRLAVDRFYTTAQPEPQAQAAAEIESWLTSRAEILASVEGRPATQPPELTAALAVYHRHLERERRILQTPTARVLRIFIDVREPRELRLAQF